MDEEITGRRSHANKRKAAGTASPHRRRASSARPSAVVAPGEPAGVVLPCVPCAQCKNPNRNTRHTCGNASTRKASNPTSYASCCRGTRACPGQDTGAWETHSRHSLRRKMTGRPCAKCSRPNSKSKHTCEDLFHRSMDEKTWDGMLARLADFRLEHGDCNVPSEKPFKPFKQYIRQTRKVTLGPRALRCVERWSKDIKLASWVSHQRKNKVCEPQQGCVCMLQRESLCRFGLCCVRMCNGVCWCCCICVYTNGNHDVCCLVCRRSWTAATD